MLNFINDPFLRLIKKKKIHRRRIHKGGKLNKTQKALLATGLTALGLAAAQYGAKRYAHHSLKQYKISKHLPTEGLTYSS